MVAYTFYFKFRTIYSNLQFNIYVQVNGVYLLYFEFNLLIADTSNQ